MRLTKGNGIGMLIGLNNSTEEIGAFTSESQPTTTSEKVKFAPNTDKSEINLESDAGVSSKARDSGDINESEKMSADSAAENVEMIELSQVKTLK